MRTRHLFRWTAALGVAGLIAVAATPASSAPVPSSTALVKSAVASDVSEVRWRGHRRGGGVAAVGSRHAARRHHRILAVLL